MRVLQHSFQIDIRGSARNLLLLGTYLLARSHRSFSNFVVIKLQKRMI